MTHRPLEYVQLWALLFLAMSSEKGMIVMALRECNWNQTKAARALGITRDNIRYRMKKYEIDPPR
jgi:transcriptional regulator with GAF, ATPase, and Fis domain